MLRTSIFLELIPLEFLIDFTITPWNFSELYTLFCTEIHNFCLSFGLPPEILTALTIYNIYIYNIYIYNIQGIIDIIYGFFLEKPKRRAKILTAYYKYFFFITIQPFLVHCGTAWARSVKWVEHPFSQCKNFTML